MRGRVEPSYRDAAKAAIEWDSASGTQRRVRRSRGLKAGHSEAVGSVGPLKDFEACLEEALGSNRVLGAEAFGPAGEDIEDVEGAEGVSAVEAQSVRNRVHGADSPNSLPEDSEGSLLP